MNKNKKMIIIILIVGLLVISATLGLTYGLWIISKSQQETNKIIAGCLNLEYEDADSRVPSINLIDEFPNTDEEGLTRDDNEYTFKIINRCNKELFYEINLEDYIEENKISPSAVSIGLDNKILGTYDSLSSREKDDSNANTAVLLKGKIIAANDTETHTLKLWIDKDAPISEQSKNFSGKIFIRAGQGINNPIQIVSGDVDTIGSEVAIGTEHFYVVESDDTSVQLLAKYNLLVGSDFSSYALLKIHTKDEEGYNKQSENAIGQITAENYNFSSTAVGIYCTSQAGDLRVGYWWDASNSTWVSKYSLKEGQEYRYVYDKDIKTSAAEYVEKYKNILEKEYGLDINETGLLSGEQAEALGCSFNTKHSCEDAPSWLYSTSYWLGSVVTSRDVLTISTDGAYKDHKLDEGYYFGIRPVLVLNKNQI